MKDLLVIESVQIRQDAHGRYSLNDLHKAAMANGKAKESQRPGEFLKSDSVQSFVAALDADLRVQKGGNNQGQGTWASREILLKMQHGFTLKLKAQYTKISLILMLSLRPSMILKCQETALICTCTPYEMQPLAISNLVFHATRTSVSGNCKQATTAS